MTQRPDYDTWLEEHTTCIGALSAVAAKGWWRWVETTDWPTLLRTYKRIGEMTIEGRTLTKKPAIQKIYYGMYYDENQKPSDDCVHCRKTGLCHVIQIGRYPEGMKIVRKSIELSSHAEEDMIVTAIPCLCSNGARFAGSTVPGERHRMIVSDCSYPVGMSAERAILKAKPGNADRMNTDTYNKCLAIMNRLAAGEPRIMAEFRMAYGPRETRTQAEVY